MAQHEVKILDSRRLPSIGLDRAGKMDRWITYEVDGTMRGLVKVPDEGFTEEAMRKAIHQDIKDRQTLVGKSFSL